MAQDEKQVFAFAIDDENALSLSMTRNMRSGLRVCGNGMKDVNATDSPTFHKGTRLAANGFHFRKLRHGRSMGPSASFESERVFSIPPFGTSSVRRQNGLTCRPVRKRHGVV